MSDQQYAFDNWEEEAEKIEIELETKEEKKVEEQKQKDNSTPNQQTEDKKKPEQSKLKLKQKIAEYKRLTPEEFNARYKDISEGSKNAGRIAENKIMNSNKDFKDFAVEVAKRLGRDINEDEAADEQNLVTFFEELTLYLYNGLEWKNIIEIQSKLKIAKNERKKNEKELVKMKRKEKRQKKAEDNEEIKINEKVQQPKGDQLFGGANLMNSKQQQEQRKQKAAEKAAEQKPTVVAVAADNDEDDDFM